MRLCYGLERLPAGLNSEDARLPGVVLGPAPLRLNSEPLPPVEEHMYRGGRYGAHNVNENRPGPAFRSSTLIIGSYFNGGVRAHDITNPFQPREIAYYVPDAPKGSKAGASQINDVFVDENRIIYAVDRFGGGLYILEMTV